MPKENFDLSHNLLITAAPGTGKSTMLAKMAQQLLSDGTISAPRKILALSAKRNTAQNMQLLIKKNAPLSMLPRFESRTFDDFARETVDRFAHLLPPSWRFSNRYQIDENLFDPFTLQPKIFAAAGDYFPIDTLSEIQLTDFCYAVMTPNQLPENISFNGKIDHDLQFYMWKYFLSAPTVPLDFPMICALAELILRTNQPLRNALQLTYGAIILDEFQDITPRHYDLLQTVFPDSRILAAGDENQCIMRWAHAMPDVRARLSEKYKTENIFLHTAFRSSPILSDVQNRISAKLSADTPRGVPINQPRPKGECAAMLFISDEDESNFIVEKIADSCDLSARQFCVIVRDSPHLYLPLLNQLAQDHSFRFRDESLLQKMLAEPLIELLFDLWENIFGDFNSAKYEKIVSFFAKSDSFSQEQSAERLADFVYSLPPFTEQEKFIGEQLDILLSKSIHFLGIPRIQNMFPRYRKGNYLQVCLKNIAHLLADDPFALPTVKDKILNFRNGNFVPVTTIQQCKAFEPDTVFFCGWEDQDFIEDCENQEELCGLLIAASRAKEKLFFSAALTRNGEPMKINRIQQLYAVLQECGIEPQIIRRK